MTGVTRIEGRAIPLGLRNVDTDVIIPAAHLKTVTREGLGRHAFETIRAEPGNVFDDPRYQGAPILIAGDNFGCGSSREHAAWALLDMGVRAVIAPSFSDIFSGNAFKNGIVTAALDPAAVDRLLALAADERVAVDVEALNVEAAGEIFPFTLDPFRRECLIKGLDEIGVTLEADRAITDYERSATMLGWTMGKPASDRRLGLRFG